MNTKRIIAKYWMWILLLGFVASGCYISAWNYIIILRSCGTDLVAELVRT